MKIEAPICVQAAARTIPGWAYASAEAKRDPNGTLHVTVHLSNRGGFVLGTRVFRAFAARYYDVVTANSSVTNGNGVVWLTLKPKTDDAAV